MTSLAKSLRLLGGYLKLSFSTLGAVGFGLALSAVTFPDHFATLFNPAGGGPAAGIAAPGMKLFSITDDDGIPDTPAEMTQAMETLKSKAAEQQAKGAALDHLAGQRRPAAP